MSEKKGPLVLDASGVDMSRGISGSARRHWWQRPAFISGYKITMASDEAEVIVSGDDKQVARFDQVGHGVDALIGAGPQPNRQGVRPDHAAGSVAGAAG
jgi:hypothetical protein